MRTVRNTDLASEIDKANASLGNVTLSDIYFQDITSHAREEFKDFGSPYANTFYVLNFSDDDVMYCRQDGIAVVAPRGTSQLVGDENFTQLKGRVLFVEVRSIDLSIYDKDIGKMDRGSRSFINNRKAAEAYACLDAATSDVRVPDFPYEEDMQKVIMNTIDDLKCDPDDMDPFKDRFITQEERYLNVVKCYTAYVIKVEGIDNDRDTYVPHLNIVLRKIPREQQSGRMSFVTTAHKSSAIFHPLTRIDSTRLLRSQNDALREHVYVETIRITVWRSYTSKRVGFLVRNGELITFPLDVTDVEEEQGVYICSKDNKGIIRETKYSLEEMEKYNLFFDKEQAIFRLNRENVKDYEAAKSINATKAETEAKEEFAREKYRETENLREKNNASAKSDVLRLLGSLFGLIVAVTTAVVALVRLFATSRLAMGFVTGVMR